MVDKMTSFMNALRRIGPMPCLLCSEADPENDRMILDSEPAGMCAWIFDLCTACKARFALSGMPPAAMRAEVLAAARNLPPWGSHVERPRGFRIDSQQ